MKINDLRIITANNGFVVRIDLLKLESVGRRFTILPL